MSESQYIVGIDLGTTNCAVAFVPVTGQDSPPGDFLIPQLQRPGEVASRKLLPSSLYVPGEHELPPGSTQLPWGESSKLIAGEFARWQGSRVPGRLVASAKSWLCHPGVDRSAPILPWGAAAEVSKVSPVEASALLLAHIAAAWNFAHPAAPLAHQDVVITVPASFDEVARALTVNAARQAGLEKFTMVEEPQAAFYDFTAHHPRDLAVALKGVRLALVVDLGGGTADFTLIQVEISPDEGPKLRRIAVGNHLILGGDNMDAALGRVVEERLITGTRKLSATQWTQLLQTTRAAKESLLSVGGPDRQVIALLAEGSRLLGGTLSTELKREEAERVILEGFLPFCAPNETPVRAARVALQELGLPYAQDPAVTRHLAAFLLQHAPAAQAALGATSQPGRSARPDAILLNGGVFNSPKIADRLIDVVSSWWPDEPRIPLLPHDSLDLAVARGAAYYGLVRRGLGRRIGGGTARAFYVGLAGAKDGATARAVCLIPRGQEEAQPVDLTTQPFNLTLGRPVQFPLFSTTADRVDRPGDVVEVGDEFHALPPIHTLFQGSGGKTTAVPVHLRAMLTELGTLELWCVSENSSERWRLEFELRAAAATPTASVTETMPGYFAEASDLVKKVYGHQATGDPRDAKQLWRNLESLMGPRESWRLPILRELWSTLYAGAKRRRRTAEHERAFFQLIGYTLRPGFGYALDNWRCEQTFRLLGESVTFHALQPVWNEFWVMWRRLAGGLNEAQQMESWAVLQPQLARNIAPDLAKSLHKLKGIQPQGLDEMVRTAASLEHLSAMEKIMLGNWIAERMRTTATAAGPWAWSLGRIGAREPIYGSSHKTVPPGQAAAWLSLLLQHGLRSDDGTAFAATQLARLTGDRARDLDEATRATTITALKTAHAPEPWIQMISEVAVLAAADEARALGDTLPIGLQLRGTSASDPKLDEHRPAKP